MKPCFFSQYSVALLASQISRAVAIPNITVVPLSSASCYNWPNYQPVRGRDFTAPFRLLSDQNDDDATNQCRAFPRDYVDAYNTTQSSLVVDVRRSPYLSVAAVYSCVNGTVGIGYGSVPPGPSLTIDKLTGALSTEPGGYKVEPYAHEINGVRQPGVFLGAKNLTTWALNYVRPAACGQMDFFKPSLQGLPSSGGGTLGFIKADPV